MAIPNSTMMWDNTGVLLHLYYAALNPLRAIPIKWSNTLENIQFDGNLSTNCLSLFNHFVVLAHGFKQVDIVRCCETTVTMP